MYSRVAKQELKISGVCAIIYPFLLFMACILSFTYRKHKHRRKLLKNKRKTVNRIKKI